MLYVTSLEKRIAIAALCIATALPLPAFAKPHAAAAKSRGDAPLRFDPPAAGSQQQTSHAAYEACIEHPSPEGAPCNCEHLLQSQPAAKAKRRHG